jgi:aminopeptidase N
VDLPKKTVDAEATLKLQSLRPLSSFALDAADFEVQSVTLANGAGDGTPVRFGHDGKKLTVDLSPAWPAHRDGTLHVRYVVREPKDGLHFFGPSKSEPDVPLTVWSQGQPVSNRYWIPCLDQPGQRQTTEVVATVAGGFEALSNGRLVERRANSDGTVTFHWLQDKPHPVYLVTLVVGPFDVVEEQWEGIPVQYYVPKGRRADVARSFGNTPKMLSFFSKRFGVRYPWDKYAQVVAEQYGGGMENTSATTLGEGALHDERSITDGPSDWLIAHELAHQWWGDLLTCREWAHIWLNEGFASYAEALWDEHAKGPDDYAYNMWGKSGGATGGGSVKTRPVVDRRYPNPDSVFDNRAYPKGAWVLHMLRKRLGEEAFWKGVQRYAEGHRLQGVETSDFRRALEEESGRDLERFFYDWTERPGNPVLDVAVEYQADAKQARVTVKQTQAGEPFQFPLTLSFRCPPASEPTRVVREVTEKEHTFDIPLPGRPDLAEVDPDQAVLAEIKETKARDLWRTQLREAPGIVSRLRAVQHLSHKESADSGRRPGRTPPSEIPASDLEILAQALPSEKFWGGQLEIARALGRARGDVSRDALIQGLSLSHPRVRQACAEALGQYQKDEKAAAALKAVLEKGDPSYRVESAALAAYARLEQPDVVAVVTPWLAKSSQNDTLRSGALEALGRSKDPAVLDALVEWTKPGKPRNCRSAAANALADLAQGSTATAEQRQRIATTLGGLLDEDSRRFRMGVLGALGRLGTSASPVLAEVDRVAESDRDGRVREAAKRTADAIRGTASGRADVKSLREEVDRLKKEQEQLKEQIKKVQKSERKNE